MNQHYWSPVFTSQFSICPIPFHVDTYMGCVFDCVYCFARHITDFHRRKSDKLFAKDIEANDPVKFSNWMKRQTNSTNTTNPTIVALKNRVPMKIGSISDPCPGIERSFHITEDFLKVLHEYDYPVQIQTKNPIILAEILAKFPDKLNLVASVTIITMRDDRARLVEPYAPLPFQRVKGIKMLTDLGYPVITKVQPAIYPFILEDLEDIVSASKEAGAWAFNTEGLKLKISMPKPEQLLVESALPGIRETYKKLGMRERSDYVMTDERKLEYITLAEELSKKYNIVYFSADNTPLGHGSGDECCGTEKLRNYKKFSYNHRTMAFQAPDADDPILSCPIKFMWGAKNKSMTIKEFVDESKPAGNGSV